MFSRAGKAFLISLVLTGLPAAAHAAPSDDVLTPTSAWLVGPASLLPPDGSGRGFCVMANQYGGGAMLRFSGAGDTLQAMAVDFRRPLFQAGRTYALEITMDGGFDALLNADAFDESTLLVNLENQPAIYGMIRSEKTMGLSVEAQAMDVALLGAADGLKRMAACSSGGCAAAQPVAYPPSAGAEDAAQAAQAIPPDYRQAVAGAGDALPPSPAAPPRPQDSSAPAPMQGMRTITNAATGASMAQQGGGQAPAAAPSAGASPQAPVPGSDGLIDRMLKKAADALYGPQPSGGGIVTPAPQAGQALALPPLQLPKPQPPKIVRGESAPDAYEQQTPPQAASAPPAGDAGPAGAAAVDAGAAGGPRRSIAVNDSDMPPDGGGVHSWLAVPGRDLRDVLAVWAYTRRVQLVWNAENDYTVRQSVATNGSFESAVQELLGQYAADPDRPVGRLYTDGAAGRQILLIEDAKSTVDNPPRR